MISRSDMRMLITSAKKGWDVPAERQAKAFADVREVLNSPESNERATETALDAIKAFEAAGWTENVESLVR
jgi:hypothetical protein